MIRFNQNALGAIAGPFDAWLTLRGLKTLSVRMERHCDNAEKVVEFLSARDDVTKIYYPGLAEHPGHEVAAKQMKRFGGMVSFEVAGGMERALEVCDAMTSLWDATAERPVILNLPATVEIATLDWVTWWDTKRLHEVHDYRTPAEVEASYTQPTTTAPATV